jgi:hypothetical protein
MRLMKKLLPGVMVLLVGVLAVGCQSFGGSGLTSTGNNSSQVQQQDSAISVGRLVSSSGLDGDGCPIDSVSSFDRSDSIYIVAENSDVPAGTDVFARLSHEGQPIEDSVLITADQDYVNTCIYFEFEATRTAEVLDTGAYEAQLIVNGNPGPSVDFRVE